MGKSLTGARLTYSFSSYASLEAIVSRAGGVLVVADAEKTTRMTRMTRKGWAPHRHFNTVQYTFHDAES